MLFCFVFKCFRLVCEWWVDHACLPCQIRGYVWCVSVCQKAAHGEKQENVFYFFASGRLALRFRPGVGSTYVHHLAALPALAGRRQSEYAVPAAVLGAVRAIYLSLYLSLSMCLC